MRFEIIREVYGSGGLRSFVTARRSTPEEAIAACDVKQANDPDALFCVVDNMTSLTIHTAQMPILV